jgi:hypothetical protein
MRTTLVSVLVILAQWGMAAYAQSQTNVLPTAGPAATGRYLPHPLAKRLFFFTSDHKTIGRPAQRGPAAQAPGIGGVRPVYNPRPISAPSGYSNLEFHPAGLLPLESVPPQDLRRFLRPKNSRLFFFTRH